LEDNKKFDFKKPSDDKWVYQYPLVVMLIAFAVVCFLVLKVIPAFQEVFNSFGKTLPWPTRVLIKVSEFLKTPMGFSGTLSVSGLIGTFIYQKMTKTSYDKKVKFFKKLNPFFVAFFGLTMGFIVWALFLPMFELGK
jgi:type IV pilus assembly protein PilC